MQPQILNKLENGEIEIYLNRGWDGDGWWWCQRRWQCDGLWKPVEKMRRRWGDEDDKMTDCVQAARKNEEMPEKMTEMECAISLFEYVRDKKSGDRGEG